ncbi:MAG: hypothetical protein R3256_04040 [Thalassovita sp.]|nr:hypothetical protein [Thalassovita sp.]
MNAYSLTLSGVKLEALESGALFWPDQRLLCVSDLHLGKSERIARLSGAFLPPPRHARHAGAAGKGSLGHLREFGDLPR